MIKHILVITTISEKDFGTKYSLQQQKQKQSKTKQKNRKTTAINQMCTILHIEEGGNIYIFNLQIKMEPADPNKTAKNRDIKGRNKNG